MFHLSLCFFDSCPVFFEYFFFWIFFVPKHLFLIVAFFLILSCLSSVVYESQENLFLRSSASCDAVRMAVFAELLNDGASYIAWCLCLDLFDGPTKAIKLSFYLDTN